MDSAAPDSCSSGAGREAGSLDLRLLDWTFVVNLPCRSGRLAGVTARLRTLGFPFEVFPAADGRAPKDQREYRSTWVSRRPLVRCHC